MFSLPMEGLNFWFTLNWYDQMVCRVLCIELYKQIFACYIQEEKEERKKETKQARFSVLYTEASDPLRHPKVQSAHWSCVRPVSF